MRAMNLCVNIIDSFKQREAAADWILWEQAHPEQTEALEWAAKEYKKWLNESKSS